MNQKMTTQTNMTRRILLRVAYDGTNYHGWQLQPNAATIEGELNRALCALTGEEIVVMLPCLTRHRGSRRRSFRMH